MIARYDSERVMTISPEFTDILRQAGRLDLQQEEVTVLAALHKAYDDYVAAHDAYL